MHNKYYHNGILEKKDCWRCKQPWCSPTNDTTMYHLSSWNASLNGGCDWTRQSGVDRRGRGQTGAGWDRGRGQAAEPVRRSGRKVETPSVLGLWAGHADLGAALAQDGELCPSVHPAAGQGRMTLLSQVHSKVSVHRPAAPFPLDLRLHLQGETSQGHF